MAGTSDNNLSDDAVIARERRKARQMRIAAPFFAGAVAGVTLLTWRYWPGLVGFTPLLLIAAFVVVMIYTWPSKRSLAPDVMRRRVDEFGAYRRSGFWSSILVAAILCFVSMREMTWFGGGVAAALIFLFFFMFFAVMMAFGRDWLKLKTVPRDDELARAIHGRAARMGYVTLMAALCAAWLTALYAPGFLLAAIRTGLFLGVAVPATIYLFLDWRA